MQKIICIENKQQNDKSALWISHLEYDLDFEDDTETKTDANKELKSDKSPVKNKKDLGITYI